MIQAIRSPHAPTHCYTTQTLFNLDTRVGVIVLTNTGDLGPTDIATQLINTFGEAVIKAGADRPKQVAWDSSWARFAGRYRGARGGETEVVLLNNRLAMINPWATNLDNVSQLEPIGDGRFAWSRPRARCSGRSRSFRRAERPSDADLRLL